MWFAKLFGGRDDGRDDEPPTAVAPPPPPATSVNNLRGRAPSPGKPVTAGAAKPKGGFDPYNSGAYDRRNAWESVKRRS